FLGVRSSQSGGAFGSLLYGLTLAALALVRAALLPFAFVAVLWFLWRCRTLPRGWFPALLAFLGFANGLIPWAVRNVQDLGEVVPVVDTTYLHLWMGNNTRATGGPQSVETLRTALAEDPHLSAEQRRPFDPKSRPDNQPLRAAESSRLLAEATWKQIQSDPAATLRRRLWAGLYFVF